MSRSPLWDLGNAIGQPIPGLGFPGSGHETASLHEQRSFIMSHCSRRENSCPFRFGFDDAPLTLETSSFEHWLLLDIARASGTNAAKTENGATVERLRNKTKQNQQLTSFYHA